jgi:hypothetical protein
MVTCPRAGHGIAVCAGRRPWPGTAGAMICRSTARSRSANGLTQVSRPAPSLLFGTRTRRRSARWAMCLHVSRRNTVPSALDCQQPALPAARLILEIIRPRGKEFWPQMHGVGTFAAGHVSVGRARIYGGQNPAGTAGSAIRLLSGRIRCGAVAVGCPRRARRCWRFRRLSRRSRVADVAPDPGSYHIRCLWRVCGKVRSFFMRG